MSCLPEERGLGGGVEELEEHIHAIEHELYPDVIQLLAEGRVHVGDGRVRVDPPGSSRA